MSFYSFEVVTSKVLRQIQLIICYFIYLLSHQWFTASDTFKQSFIFNLPHLSVRSRVKSIAVSVLNRRSLQARLTFSKETPLNSNYRSLQIISSFLYGKSLYCC